MMFTEAELAEDRADAESRMVSTYLIGVHGKTEYVNGVETRPLLSSFATKGRLRSRTSQSQRETEAGERTIVAVDRELHIPWDSPDVPVNAVARPVSIDPATGDPTIAGADLLLVGPVPGEQQTARRLLVRETLT